MTDALRPRHPVLAALTLVLTGAALDAFLVRQGFAHWPTQAGLYLELLVLWGALALLAALPAGLIAKLSGGRVAFAPALLVCLAGPIAAHAALNSFTQTGSQLSEVLRPAPLAAAAAAALGVCICAGLLARLGRALGERTPKALLATCLLAAIVGLFLPHRTPWTGPRVADDDRPDVVLLVLDTVRSRSMDLFGNDARTTPFLTELASDAARYTDARSVSCFTFTSHLSMLTGVYPSEHRARLMNMRYDRAEAPHVAELFNEAGYRTGAFVGTNVLAGKSGIAYGFETYDDVVDPGLTYGFAWAMIHDMQSLGASLVPALNFNGRPHWIQDYQRDADEVLARAGAWLAEDDGRPSFCMINLYDVHWPYVPEAPFAEELVDPYDGPVDGFGHRSSSLPKDYALTDRDDTHLTQLYEAELLELDRDLEAFLGQLDLGRTALLITSDHGEAFGEGGRYEHNDILEPQVDIPLIVRRAGGDDKLVSDRPVTNLDVAPTLLGLAGLVPHPDMRGLDLTQVEPPADRIRLVEDRDHLSPDHYRYAIYREGFKWVRTGPKAEGAGLFDVRTDRIGLDDLTAVHPALADELAELLDAERAKWSADDTAPASGDMVDGLGDLGYLGD